MKKEYCPHCHRSMMSNRHSFNKPLARIFLIITNNFGPGEPFHLQRDFSDFSHNQYNNFQKLQYWNLVEKHRDFQGKRAGGFWRLTPLALRVICCDPIPRWIRTFNRKIIERSEEQITLKGAVGYYEIPKKWAAKARPFEKIDSGQISFNYKERQTCHASGL